MNATVKVLPPALERAEENFKGTKRGDRPNMTRKVDRPGPVTPYTIAMDIARQMPMVFLVGFIAWKLDQRNEENAKARLSEAQENSRTILTVVQANTEVMRQVMSTVGEVPRSIDALRAEIRHP